jgi:hypothetical protein
MTTRTHFPKGHVSEEQKERILELLRLYQNGGLTGPQIHEVHPGLSLGSRENYLYFTLPCCINYQRSSPALWQSALDTWDDEETRYLFFPERVSEEIVAQICHDMRKHRLAVQTFKHPLIWRTIGRTLFEHYGSDPRAILEEGNYDVPILIRHLQTEKRDRFPYLGGIKLSNYWLFILSRFTDARFLRLEELSIIPDRHIVRSTVRLGLADERVKPQEVEALWRPLLKELGILPTEMHPVLWAWSRGGFVPEV